MSVDTDSTRSFDADRAYIEHDFERAMIGEIPLAATSWEELKQLCVARGLTHYVRKIKQRDYRYIRHVVLEKLKEYRQEDNFALLHPDL